MAPVNELTLVWRGSVILLLINPPISVFLLMDRLPNNLNCVILIGKLPSTLHTLTHRTFGPRCHLLSSPDNPTRARGSRHMVHQVFGLLGIIFDQSAIVFPINAGKVIVQRGIVARRSAHVFKYQSSRQFKTRCFYALLELKRANWETSIPPNR